jgi:hypothetical protein
MSARTGERTRGGRRIRGGQANPRGRATDESSSRLTNRPETEAWLLDHGYALAASDFKGRTGYHIAQGLHDQIALLDRLPPPARPLQPA